MHPVRLAVTHLRPLVLPMLGIVAVAYDTIWATWAGRFFVFIAVAACLTGLGGMIVAAAGYLHISWPAPWQRYVLRFAVVISVILSIGAGWWVSTSALIGAWFCWALTEEIDTAPTPDDPHDPTPHDIHLN